jgi:hypothetical protein
MRATAGRRRARSGRAFVLPVPIPSGSSAKRTQTDSLAGRLYTDSVVDGTLDALLAAKLSLRCLYRNVPEQKLNLLQFASSRVTQPSTSPAEVMGCQFVDPSFRGIFAHYMPDSLLRKALSPRLSHLVHPPKQLSRCQVSSFDPLVQKLFTHIGIGIVRICPAFPFRSTMAQCSSRR